MIWAAVIAGVVSAASAAIKGGVAASANKKRMEVYQQAAKDVKEATEKYAGEGLNRRMTEAGMANAAKYGNLYNNVTPDMTRKGSAMANFNQGNFDNSAYNDLYNQGANTQATLDNAQWNRVKNKAEQNIAQADTNYNARTAAGQAIANGISGLADTAMQIGGFANKTGAK